MGGLDGVRMWVWFQRWVVFVWQWRGGDDGNRCAHDGNVWSNLRKRRRVLKGETLLSRLEPMTTRTKLASEVLRARKYNR